MKRILLLFTGILLSCATFSQVIYQIKADSVRIYSDCDTAELILENHTQTVNGFLYNKGKGRTEFRGLQLQNLGDTALAIVGQDTLSFGVVLRSVEFTTGDPGFPAAGDSVYSNPMLTGKKIKVFREHLFQYTVGPDRISFDPLTGIITFIPPLKAGERIYIEGTGAAAVSPNPPDTQHISSFNFTNAAQDVAGWTDLAGAPHAQVITATDPATGFGVTSIDTSLWNPVYYSGVSIR